MISREQQRADRVPVAQHIYRVLVSPNSEELDGQGARLLASAAQYGITGLRAIATEHLFFLRGMLHMADVERLAALLLADPLTETAQVEEWQGQAGPEERDGERAVVEVTYLPGVTDSPGDSLVRAAAQLGITGLEEAATGRRYTLAGKVDPAQVARFAAGVLANPVVQRFTVDAPVTPPFARAERESALAEKIALLQASHEELLAISRERRLSLDLPEMLAIQAYFRSEGRDPTDVELETLAQTWSEHCVHKTFKAKINYVGPAAGDLSGATVTREIDGLLNTTIRAATESINRPWVRSAFVDNAGITAFDERYDLAFKVETHNHPSALEPFGGANTGIGGVVRDVLGVSARPIANTDVLCFGPEETARELLPAGVLHPHRIAAGVVAGIEDYGNKMGIPTVNGAILYHEGYTANPLVYCGCLGILPRGSHPTAVQPGDLIIALGGRTGRDGLRGATFSSMEMDVSTSEVAGSAVQIGNPITEKQVQELILLARDEGLYNAITDCGAGGFSSAIGEMGEGVGARVQLRDAPLKYSGLLPWEIWLSEAQERMVLAVPRPFWPRLQELARGQDVEAFCLGEFEDSGQLRIFYDEALVGDLSMSFLHDGVPRQSLQAIWEPPAPLPESGDPGLAPQEALLKLLAFPNIRSKETVLRRYDHEVQGGTAVKPLTGVANQGPSDAAVIVPQVVQETHSPRAVAIGNGICPQYGQIDPYLMAWAAIDEALRNVVAAGADPDTVAILDNFCWGNPNLPDRLG
ncbi:MAG: phosphoribosylformylglycinamidine synthase subunit PurS, partial [Candidatus Promineifilaceae bacterium]